MLLELLFDVEVESKASQRPSEETSPKVKYLGINIEAFQSTRGDEAEIFKVRVKIREVGIHGKDEQAVDMSTLSNYHSTCHDEVANA